MLFTVLLALHVVLAFLLIGVILIQQGKGATAGAAFGSGASSTVFGARGSASFLTRLTAILAILFFSNSLYLAYLYGEATQPKSLLDHVEAPPVGIVSEQAPVPTAPTDQPPAPMVIDVPPTITPSDVPTIPAPEAAAPAAAPATEQAAPPPAEQQ